ncbi:MAG TPA: antitoxin Xre/MbcA/ParS toxin-binding domain-containing protein [Chryseosolibacter sp.]|nr:antitoxin Xre/MbcA/ParS toxin-binding domain-containing protein [Chryseosolibacter sp.]
MAKRTAAKEYNLSVQKGSKVHEAKPAAYHTFSIRRKGKLKQFSFTQGYGHFIAVLKAVKNELELREKVKEGLTPIDIEPIKNYLQLSQSRLAETAAVSESTVSRWSASSPIGKSASAQFIKIDQLIAQGVELFGSEEAFHEWLTSTNLALGNVKPLDLLVDPVGLDMVEAAVDAMNQGNVL